MRGHPGTHDHLSAARVPARLGSRHGVAERNSTQTSTTTRAEALRDLLESPRHTISEKDRKWLRAELRRETMKP